MAFLDEQCRNYVLQETYDLSPPVQWTTVSGLPELTNEFQVLTTSATNTATFYRLAVP